MSDPKDLVADLLSGRSRLTGWAFIERFMGAQIEACVTTERHWNDHLESAGLMPSWMRYSAFKNEYPDDPVPPEINAVVGERDLKPVSEWEEQALRDRRDLE
jgi:hypothetical protein